ncbi:MAG: NERD domain-containing protein [Opitutaceae bacterium]|nr:NERD domain-containing protein [Opitutaceae bacterium]
MTTLLLSGVFGYGLLLSTGSAALFHWRLRSRHRRPPVEFKLLRGPGELSLRSLRRLEANLPVLLLVGVTLPLLAGLGLLLYVATLSGSPQITTAVLGGLGLLTGLFLGGRFLLKQINLRRDLELRYLGERAVAEELAPLLPLGYRMFHDVAIHGVDSNLDLDHVLVGPNGITVIEAETRRRERRKGAAHQHEVSFDGKQLTWPWGPDRDTVADVETESASFTKWLLQTTGYRVPAVAVLTLPGWWIAITGRGIVTVVNHKQVLSTITERTAELLAPEQIEKICKELEAHCRDVEA